MSNNTIFSDSNKGQMKTNVVILKAIVTKITFALAVLMLLASCGDNSNAPDGGGLANSLSVSDNTLSNRPVESEATDEPDVTNEPEVTAPINISVEPYLNTIAAGYERSFAIRADGSLWAWGDNSRGQLGDGTDINKSEPCHIMDDVASVTACKQHTLAIKTDGSLWAWGNNTIGQLGNGTGGDRDDYIPDPVKIMDDVAAAAGGSSHSLALKTDGSLWAWGSNRYKQLGDDSINGYTTTPVKIMYGVIAIAAGGNHSFAIKADGSLWAWGTSDYGEIGSGNQTNYTEEIAIPEKIMDNVASVSTSEFHTLILTTDGRVVACGNNSYGKVGDTEENFVHIPINIEIDNVAAVYTGYDFSVALKADGSVWFWGLADIYNQFGAGFKDQSKIPVLSMEGAVDIAAGNSHTLALQADGSLLAWGKNIWGPPAGNPKGYGPTQVMDDVKLP